MRELAIAGRSSGSGGSTVGFMPPAAAASGLSVIDRHERDDLLAAAARIGLAQAVRNALSLGADPSKIAANGRTPVFEAAYHGHLEVLAVLCDSEAEVGAAWTASHTGMTYTAREIALLCGHIQVRSTLPERRPFAFYWSVRLIGR